MTEPAAPALSVDDDADLADLVEDFLTSDEYTVTTLRDRRLESVQTAGE